MSFFSSDKTNVKLPDIGQNKKLETITASENNKLKYVHNALMLAGMTPAIGNIADIADATLYALEGEFGEAGWAGASAIPVIGQMVASRRALKKAKDSGEEIVTLFRAVDKWHKGSMVKKGKFVGSNYGRYNPNTWKDDLPKGTLWVADNFYQASVWAKKAPDGTKTILEFEVPKKILNNMDKISDLQGSGAHGKLLYNYGLKNGLDKGFLKKVHKGKPSDIHKKLRGR